MLQTAGLGALEMEVQNGVKTRDADAGCDNSIRPAGRFALAPENAKKSSYLTRTYLSLPLHLDDVKVRNIYS